MQLHLVRKAGLFTASHGMLFEDCLGDGEDVRRDGLTRPVNRGDGKRTNRVGEADTATVSKYTSIVFLSNAGTQWKLFRTNSSR
jgi:hypothetical protein